MGIDIGSILTQAIGVAISPVPIIAVILMLFSRRARRNGSAFLVGWVLALAVVGSIALELANLGRVSTGGTPSTAAYTIKLLLGISLLWLAIRRWRRRPKEGEEPQMPKWMATIDAIGAGKAFGLAALLAGVNPKNLALTLAAALTIANAGLSGSAPWIVLVIFIILASLSVAAPVLYYLFAGQSAEKRLNTWKAWLVTNNVAVIFILLLVFGVLLIGQGLNGLIG